MKKRYFIAIAILLVICLLLFLLTHFSNATILSTEGYFVSGEDIEEVLLSETIKNYINSTYGGAVLSVVA